jgi:hypothetical protein
LALPVLGTGKLDYVRMNALATAAPAPLFDVVAEDMAAE